MLFTTNEMIFLTGIARLIMGAYALQTAFKTWDNPHPDGKEINPKFMLAFACLALNDGVRSVFFSVDPTSDGVYLSLWITLLLCWWAVYRTRRVNRTFASRLD